MDNGSITGKAYPAFLAKAYEVARLWVIPSQKKAVTTSLTLVATEDRSRVKNGGGRGAGGRGTGGRGWRKRLAKEEIHSRRNSSLKRVRARARWIRRTG